MGWNLWNIFRRNRRRKENIDPDEIFIDAHNLPDFDVHQFEGRLEQPISKMSLTILASIFLLVVCGYMTRLWILQVEKGEAYLLISENNRLKHTLIFAERGAIYDREGEKIAWNTVNPETGEFPLRKYLSPGFTHVVGYVKYPAKDTSGVYYEENFKGMDGIEKYYDSILAGQNGIRISEIDALGNIYSKSTVKLPEKGDNVRLSIDAGIQSKLYRLMEETANNVGYKGGAGVIMDVNTGEIIALASYPEYDQEVLAQGKDVEKIRGYLTDPKNAFLNRVVSGLYTPGSIIKPFIAAGVAHEKIIDPQKQILSTGELRVPNPYFPGQYTVFKDWKAHGYVDFREAIAVSSNVYFYNVGGGFGDQKGIGISNIEKYVRLFGFGSKTGIDSDGEALGVIPNPAWKEKNFNGEPWRLGDTYNSAIGQYGFQVTPIQSIRALAGVANGGFLVNPTLLLATNKEVKKEEIGLDAEDLQLVREGMRMTVTQGTAGGLNVPFTSIAAKTGTAQLGISKANINSWITGFFPYEHPKYAFVIVMDRGPHDNGVGAQYVMRQLLDWMNINKPQYFE